MLSVEPDKKTAGHKLLYLHATGMFLMPVLFFVVQMIRIPLFICYIPLYIYHLVEKRCPVTHVERRLHGEDKTVIDLFLNIVGLPITVGNRDIMLIFLSTGFMVYAISIMSTL